MISVGGATGPTDPETPFQALHHMASLAKDNVGQSAEGNEAREAQMEDGRVVRGRARQSLSSLARGRMVQTEKATEA